MLDHLIDDDFIEDPLRLVCLGAITHCTALLHCDLSFDELAMLREVRKALYQWQGNIEK